MVHWGMVQGRIDFGSRFDLNEEPIAGLLVTKKGGNDPKDIATAPFRLMLSKFSYKPPLKQWHRHAQPEQ